MSQPVKLSDEIVIDARLVSQVFERSIAGQIEYWAQLGRAIEPLLNFRQALALRQSAQGRGLSQCLDAVDSDEGRHRLKAYLATQPFPHYEACSENPALLLRIDEDGTRTPGRFVNRKFVPQSP